VLLLRRLLLRLLQAWQASLAGVHVGPGVRRERGAGAAPVRRRRALLRELRKHGLHDVVVVQAAEGRQVQQRLRAQQQPPPQHAVL
jgi:hypothetical protein